MVRYAAAVLLTATLALPAAAQTAKPGKSALKLVEHSAPMLPPANYKGQWWRTADNCEYSRAGRPGETVWYLIVNTAHEGCARRLIQRAYSDYQ
ncbi:hypothetical protein [uncultured Roseobacter sp.]|uniref:hypothetical protein n=1 Tax=uncultured Roseobacter sp. TaxID=114847 RepID=UPI0026027655|nr:hypothetical protein [uncultured Roseobacter sp.]